MNIKKIKIYLLSLLILVPTVLAKSAKVVASKSEDHVLTGFQELVSAFSSLFSDTPSDFTQHFIAFLPLLGLFLIVFGLTFFITKVTIFKDPEHNRYASMIAWGVGLIGLAQRKVYNVILSWSSTFLILSFILMMVFLFILFLTHNRKKYYESSKDMLDSKKDYFTSKTSERNERKKLSVLEHEMSLDKKNYTKIDHELDSLNSDLRNISKIYGSELSQVDKMAALLRKITSAANSGNAGSVHDYIKTLSGDLGSLMTTFSHEHKDVSKLYHLLDEVRHHEAYLFKNESKELTEEEHLKKILNKHLKAVHNKDENSIKLLSRHFLKDETEIKRHLRNIRHSSIHLNHLQDKIETLLENLEKFGYQSKHEAASAVREAILANNFNEANHQLDRLRSLIEHGEHYFKEIAGVEREVSHHVDVIRQNERAMQILLRDVETLEKRLKKEESK